MTDSHYLIRINPTEIKAALARAVDAGAAELELYDDRGGTGTRMIALPIYNTPRKVARAIAGRNTLIEKGHP